MGPATMRKVMVCAAALAMALGSAVDAQAQDPSHRFGKWQMESDNPPPFINIMTYEPWGDGGMSITVESTNARGQDNAWGYDTMFDGEFREVWGQENAQTAVEWVNERTTRISNMRNGRVTQVIINTLSEDGNTISNEYVRLDENGKITGVGHAVYRRISQ
ncbi:MAG: hypothetical protein AMS19_07095 [Gemmatimonas sp. SG8_23]|jgi:hypothetical protein|nr:MAG: hypothetical protein AMS19_07095 [Gemmatimonas sp. SG8_23]